MRYPQIVIAIGMSFVTLITTVVCHCWIMRPENECKHHRALVSRCASINVKSRTVTSLSHRVLKRLEIIVGEFKTTLNTS